MHNRGTSRVRLAWRDLSWGERLLIRNIKDNCWLQEMRRFRLVSALSEYGGQ